MEQNNCCQNPGKNKGKGIVSGLIYGLIPHTFCIAFIVFSVLGTTLGISIAGRFLLIPYFFQALVALSLIAATISAAIYLKKLNLLSFPGVKTKWRYLTLMYSATIAINLLMFFVVFPAVANLGGQSNQIYASGLSAGVLKVQIPCSGHAPLVISEIKKDSGVDSVYFKMPNLFEIKYNPEKTSLNKIASLDIFKDFKATIQ